MADPSNGWVEFSNRPHQSSQNSEYSFGSHQLFEASTDIFSTNQLPSMPLSAQPQPEPTATSNVSYQCTICLKAHNRKDSWEKHEATHASFKRLKCCARTFPVINNQCVVCLSKDTSEQHISTHRKKGRAGHCGRFLHVYELGEHLKRYHRNVPELDEEAAKNRRRLLKGSPWYEEVDVKARYKWCGFCKNSYTTWGQRMSCVNKHYRAGCTMEGDWEEMAATSAKH
jgi:hypothetical protein